MTKVAPAPVSDRAAIATPAAKTLAAASGPASPKAATTTPSSNDGADTSTFTQITGATGSNAATLNGVYKQQQPDLYRKVDGVDGDGKEGVWLYFATDRRWHVSSRTANMAARKPCEHSYGHTITPVADTAGKPAPPRQPHEVKGGWLVDLGGDDVGESVKESTVAVAAGPQVGQIAPA